MLRPRKFRALSGGLLACIAVSVGGCGNGGFGRSEAPTNVNPNEFPADYRTELVKYLTLNLSEVGEFRNAFVAEPALKHLNSDNTSSDLRYVVCLRLGGGAEKMAIYFGGRMTQFLDAPREQCGSAAYQPFPELALTKPAQARAR